MDKIESVYVPPNMTSMINEYNDGMDAGMPPRVDALNDVLAWKKGFITGWYGWANDGKGTMYDFLSMLTAKYEGWKHCFFKQEDMGSHKVDGKTKISANDIYNNLVWTLTGKTPLKNYAKRNHIPQINFDEYMDALEFVEKHFFVIYPKDRHYKTVMDNFKYMHEKYGIDSFLVDPFKSLILDESSRGDMALNNMFVEAKEFALSTNTCVNYIAHPKSVTDVRVKAKQGENNGAFRVVDQFMIAGGAAWDNNMDAQYSIYRPERHLNPNDPKVHFFNLKQRKSEIVGARRGVYEKIVFDPKRKQYFFDGICPMDGSMKNPSQPVQAKVEFPEPLNDDDLPF